MKKVVFLIIILLTSFLMVNAQKQSGIVYSEHDGITKTRAMWAAFLKGDKETYLSFYADSVWSGNNGSMERRTKEQFGGMMDWWNKEFKNLSITDDKPAYPDALQFKEGGLFVQDWLKLTGIHEKTGINLDWPFHNVYRFNDQGKVDVILQYYDPARFKEINNSQRTIEDGVVYKFHPYISNTRKAVNAYNAKDLQTWLSFYTPNAVFNSLSLKDGESIDLKTKIANTKNTFATYNTINLKQSGEPVCVSYEKTYNVVYSWWVLSVTTMDGKKKSDIPVMLTHLYDDNGKIMSEAVYMDSKRLE